MTPSWYDVLGVDADADPTTIRTRFKSEISDLDPTDRRFRLLSRAAEVLLDPKRRAAHDAELAAQPGDDHADDADESWFETTTGTTTVPVVSSASTDVTRPGAPTTDKVVKQAKAPKAPKAPKEPRATKSAGPSAGRGPLVTTIVLGVLALALVVGAVVSLARGGDTASAAAADGLPDSRQVAAARAAAEAAIVPVLSYDYRHLEQDRQAAIGYLTPGFVAEYGQLFDGLIQDNSPSTRTVVQARLLASGIARTGKDRVDVVLFVDQSTTNRKATTPEIYQNQVIAQMVDTDGTWLVDCLVTTPDGGCQH